MCKNTHLEKDPSLLEKALLENALQENALQEKALLGRAPLEKDPFGKGPFGWKCFSIFRLIFGGLVGKGLFPQTA